MDIGLNGLFLIKFFESFRAKAYKDPVGIWTIGYGTTKIYGSPVVEGMEINELVAIALMRGDLQEPLQIIERHVRVPLKQNQIDALASFIYNIGSGNFLDSSLLKVINTNKPVVEDLFTRWNKGTIDGKLVTLDGLTKRRKREFRLYSTGVL